MILRTVRKRTKKTIRYITLGYTKTHNKVHVYHESQKIIAVRLILDGFFFQLNSVDLYEDSDSEIETDASKFNKSPVKATPPKNVSSKPKRAVKSAPTTQQRKTTASKTKPQPPESDSEEEEENEKLMLSIADIKVCWHCRMQSTLVSLFYQKRVGCTDSFNFFVCEFKPREKLLL